MLRPATPLAILLFAAFALLLLSVLSTPIIKAIPLGNYHPETGGTVNFGVFGYCLEDSCGPIEIGYDTSIFAPQNSSEFDLPPSTRTRLSAILIVHPVAAFLTLVNFIMAVVAHFHSPSHSSRYLCGLFIFGFVNFLVCLLAFLIDVLLFVPHLAWGSWLVLAATILVFLSFIVSCAMRRTLVGRKARKRRIAENAEMSGENYYNRQAQQEAAAASVITSTLQPTVPSIGEPNGPSDKLPQFTAYEKRDDRSSDEQISMARTPSDRVPNNVPTDPAISDLSNNGQSFSGSTIAPTDQYGNPLAQAPDAYGMRRGPSVERMDGRGRGGPPGGYRGRGGYGGPGGRGGYGGPNGRGGYAGPPNGRGGYGGPNGRGGYGGPNGRGGYGGPNGRGGYGGPPNARGAYGPPGRGGFAPGTNGRGGYGPRGGYAGVMRGGRTPPPGYPGGEVPYDRRGSPASPYGYPSEQQPSLALPGASYEDHPSTYNGPPGAANAGRFQAYRPDDVDDLPRAESPPPLPANVSITEPVGEAVELDATTGGPAHPPAGFGQLNNPRGEVDADAAGTPALQEAGAPTPAQHDAIIGDSQEEQYVPPRQAWDQQPDHASQRGSPSLQRPLRAQELDSATHSTPPPAPPVTLNGATYYEDIDPRFADPPSASREPTRQGTLNPDDLHLAPGARSPAVSERSAYTAMSQRSVNRWNSPGPGQGPSQPGSRGRSLSRHDVDILNNNPDFELPGHRTSSAHPSGPGGSLMPGSPYPGI